MALKKLELLTAYMSKTLLNIAELHTRLCRPRAPTARSSNRERALQKGYQLFWPNASRLFTCPLASMRCHFALWLIILFSVVAIVRGRGAGKANNHGAALTNKKTTPPLRQDLGFLDRVSPEFLRDIFFFVFSPSLFLAHTPLF